MIPQGVALATAVVGLLTLGLPVAATNGQGSGDQRAPAKPQLRVRANPTFGYPPLRVVVTGEVVGGPNDYEEYYCAKVEWDWGDGGTSSFAYDCDPYEPGKSEMRRRFVADHTYNIPGRVDIWFRLKQGSKVVGSARTPVTISGAPVLLPRPGARP
jgi:hypothetical protein